ncbi:transglycosylase SLT domain-containing protein [Pelistega suis]|uniref:transglycosylase SLT domain-containing protein n=1 Tax=Pelistega suis TaxID=1631957 RepID=UPI00211C9AA5|nr:transglycosylase SLT domain-containing protein [Pelistega suis]MCQ9328809.1 transglycosylase SLT domain-containing protein [Pelistega suis]
MKSKYLWVVLTALCAACANTTPPSKPENMCEIVQEKPYWGEALEVSREKWGVPPQVVLSIIYQESSFKHDAQPPMSYFLGFIPTGRASSAYGYPQAKDEVWGDYKKQTQNSSADRDDFDDAVDFIGWYMSKTQQINGVSKWDAYSQYLNYHEGWTGYAQQTYESKGWLKNVAQRVKERAERYGAQYAQCR